MSNADTQVALDATVIEEIQDDQLVEDDDLVEEISIDGMCGVY
ncbi:MAG TPA: mycofactocin precursor MftA [Kribbella sp.]|nr:mycofactocin precursor MftA [Kribbella sp.]HET6295185.1 mycofactocin precursor MftA [Kribbella sp.]